MKSEGQYGIKKIKRDFARLGKRNVPQLYCSSRCEIMGDIDGRSANGQTQHVLNRVVRTGRSQRTVREKIAGGIKAAEIIGIFTPNHDHRSGCLRATAC